MAQDYESKGNAALWAVVALVIGLGIGYFIGQQSATDVQAGAEGSAQNANDGDAPSDSAGASKLPVGKSYAKGKDTAPITVIEFSDFQCPFCLKGYNNLKAAMKKYPNDVRVVFKHFPLGFHKQAPAASTASLAAGEQGKFWEMHDLLFEKQKEYRGKDDAAMKALGVDLAKQLGLDVAKFEKDFDKPEFAQAIKDDTALGSSVGVRGTPHFFINGERVSGAQPTSKFEEVIKRQLDEAKKALAAGVKREDLYAKMVEKNYKAAPTPEQRKAPAQRIEMVSVRPNGAIKGERKDFSVTIVEFSDFQCPFCTRVNPTMDQIMKNFGKDVRIVFKQNPLPFHKEADAAHRAAVAANEQGKFWEMHDLLFENQKAFKGADMDKLMVEYAQKLGLNAAKFKKSFDDPKTAAIVKEDLALGAKVGARGTPNFFVNGIQLVGAKPYPAFESVIKEQLKKAANFKKTKKLSGDALYKALVEDNKKNAPKAAAAAKPAAPAPKVDLKDLNIKGSPVKGAKNAKVTIYEYSDFHCPFCSRGNDTVQQVLKEYGKDVNLVFKAFPLPFHKKAEPAHRAALAAHKQGKFWEMHDKMFATSKEARDGDINEIIQRSAKEVGLNMAKFDKDFASDALKALVQDEIKQGQKIGVRGTPAFFINGNRLVGAQPFPKFKELIDKELGK
jgi:protein-disulfide isomerase